MTQEKVTQLDITEFAELVNGKVAGIRLAFSLFIASTQEREKVEDYIEVLERTRRLIEEGVEDGVYEFGSEGYPKGTLIMLKELIDSLSDTER